MAKELPYFKFTIQEWQNGKISTLSDSLKGVFIDVCCYYWAQNCNVNYDMLICKFKTKEKSIQKLIESQTIQGQLIDKTKQIGVVSISFLDQQLTECKQTKSFFSEMGKLGQKVKKLQAPLKTDLSNKIIEDNIIKDNIENRFQKFKLEVFSFTEYTQEMLNEFLDHWVEKNKSKTKMKFEMEDTWDLSLRLKKWKSNSDKWSGVVRQKQDQPTGPRLKELKHG